MRRSGTGPARTLAGVVLVVGLLAFCAVTLPSVAAYRTSSAAPERGSAPASAGVPVDFGARAGFAPWHAADSVRTAPAERPQSVDVVFQPQNGSPLMTGGAGPIPVAAFAGARGLTPTEYAAAEQYFARDGLRVVHTWPDRLALSLEGTPAALDRAFGTTLRAGSYAGRPVVFPAVAPSLPSALEAEVAGVVGLASGFDTFSISLSSPHEIPRSPDGAPLSSNSTSTVTPGMARALYGLNGTSGLYNLSGGPPNASSQSIALVLWGAGYDPTDIATFYAEDYPSSFPLPVVTPYPIDGASPPSGSALGSSDPLTVEELTLDIEWSGSMAPGATLDPIYAPGPSSTNLTDAIETALSLHGVTAISMSFGAAESSDRSLASSWNSLFSEAAARQITVLAATGDTGGDANASCTGGPAPEYPATSPEVLAVGGTAVSIQRNLFGTITGFSEAAWADSGGGFSTQAAPSWQLNTTAKGAIEAGGGGRGTPDVSATASDDFIYFAGADQEADGTSFATPLWAGIIVGLDAHITGHRLGWFTDRLYYVATNQTLGGKYDGIADITSGGNCIDPQISTGWDPATGWGSPRATPLYEELAGSFVNLTLEESPSTVAPGGSVTIRVQVANWSTGAVIPDTPVQLRLEAGTSIGPCTGTFGSVSATSNATGWASAQMTVPVCFLGSHAIASASVTTDRLFGTNSTRIAVNLLGLVPALESLGNPPYSYALYAAVMASAVAAGGWLGRRRPPAPVTVPAGTPAPPAPVTPPAVPAPAAPAAGTPPPPAPG